MFRDVKKYKALILDTKVRCLSRWNNFKALFEYKIMKIHLNELNSIKKIF